MRTYQVEGIVVKRQNSGESDRVITVFTKQLGKIKVKATGVRKIASKRASHIELLNLSSLSLYKGNSLPILTEANVVETFSFLKEDLPTIGFAYHICELIDSLCPENQEHEGVFQLLTTTLHQLGEVEKNLHKELMKSFELSLLRLLGYYTPQLELQQVNTTYLIESILERKLKTRITLL